MHKNAHTHAHASPRTHTRTRGHAHAHTHVHTHTDTHANTPPHTTTRKLNVRSAQNLGAVTFFTVCHRKRGRMPR
eukprot:14779464-Alexandrium_andersonii.AAC.1